MALVKIGIDVSDKKDCLYPAGGNKFKTWVAVYQEDLNPDIYSYDKLKFRVVVHI
jgi:hypothetical protein